MATPTDSTPALAAKDKRAPLIAAKEAGSAAAAGRPTRLRGIGKMRKLDLCPFTQRLAAMLDAGLPLVQAMDALAEQSANPNFQKVVKEISGRIEAGDSFAEALERYKELFGDLYISMIRAGEMGGGLAEVAGRLAKYMETSAAMMRKVKSAMTYPIVVMALAFVMTTGMIIFIVPVFAGIFADFGAQLPKPTQILLNISNVLRRDSPVVVAVAAVAIYLFRRFLRTEHGALVFDRWVLKAPVAGQIIMKVSMGRMARTFASMIRSGVPILRSMEIVAQASGNKYIGAAIIAASKKIEGGSPLASALKDSGQFPPMVLHMIAAGEKTGNVDGMLEKVADFYEDEVANALESLSSMIEPLLMAFLGIVIGGIVICMFMPIFKMNEIVGN
ncbi:MAG: type II secretion system F family protein [Lentisphaeria bacterium]